MAKKNTFQRLTDVLVGVGNGGIHGSTVRPTVASYDLGTGKQIIYATDNEADRDEKLKQLKQQNYLDYLWKKTGYDTSMVQELGATQVRIMYRDADLMTVSMPEIGSAVETVAEEATTVNHDGKILSIFSKSERIKAVLEDLFYNRLDIDIWLTTIVHETVKYGNEFMFLNIDHENGIRGWRELPVHEMRRLENGVDNVYGTGSFFNPNFTKLKPDEVSFVWDGHNEQSPFKNWMIAHFRLITDSVYLPYGCSWLNKARRHWRMLSMMEDAMLIYRLERSIERRIFKVNVGAIDSADVPAYIQEFMNRVKRAPIIDPQTGQVDLRKNFLDVTADYIIPVRDQQDPSSIETLANATNSTSMEDIEYMEKKILSALRVPKSFLGFSEAQGKAQNMSAQDIRFSRVVNRVQKAIIMELNKIAIIHLYLLGFEDDLTNFTLSLNNPSNQVEMNYLDVLTKRIAAASSALAEQGGGLPLMSWHSVQREIMGKTDAEIDSLLNEMRLENALAIELQRTPEIIRRTHIFDKVDRIYGEPGAKYQNNPQGAGGPGGMGGPGGGPGGGGMPPLMGEGFGDGLGDLGEPGADTEGDINGQEGGADLESMGGGGGNEAGGPPDMGGGAGPAPLAEEILDKYELPELAKRSFLMELNKEEEGSKPVPILSKSLMINEGIDSILRNIDLIGGKKGKQDLVD